MILVRLPNHVGDACMALPAVRLLAESGCALTLVGKAWAEDLLAGEGWRFEVIEGRLGRDLSHIGALARTLGEAPRGLLMPNSFSSALLFRMAGVRSAGFATDFRRFLLADPIPEPPRMHEVERFWRAAQGALAAWRVKPAATAAPREIGLRLSPQQKEAADRLIADFALPTRYALLAPVATGLHRGRVKHWAHFGALIEPLRQRGIEPVAMPTAAEATTTRAALPAAKILPPGSLGTYVALAARAALVVANDSGISHVAATVGAPQVTIFGVTEADRTAPWNPRAVCVGGLDAWPSVPDVLAAIDLAMER